MKRFKINNNIVEDCTILEFASGIKQVMINTKEKCISYGFIDEYTIEFEDEDQICEIKIEKDDLNLDNQSYIRTETQNKNQVSIYYIPFTLLKRPKKVNKNAIIMILKTINNKIVDMQIAKNDEEIGILEKAGYVLDIDNESEKCFMVKFYD